MVPTSREIGGIFPITDVIHKHKLMPQQCGGFEHGKRNRMDDMPHSARVNSKERKSNLKARSKHLPNIAQQVPTVYDTTQLVNASKKQCLVTLQGKGNHKFGEYITVYVGRLNN